jgi:hypothetical protein
MSKLSSGVGGASSSSSSAAAASNNATGNTSTTTTTSTGKVIYCINAPQTSSSCVCVSDNSDEERRDCRCVQRQTRARGGDQSICLTMLVFLLLTFLWFLLVFETGFRHSSDRQQRCEIEAENLKTSINVLFLNSVVFLTFLLATTSANASQKSRHRAQTKVCRDLIHRQHIYVSVRIATIETARATVVAVVSISICQGTTLAIRDSSLSSTCFV